MAQTPTPQPDQPVAAKPRRSRILVLGLVGGLVLGLGSAGAYWFLKGPAPAEAKSAVVDEPGALVPLNTFLVNIAGASGQAYLRVTLKVLVADKHQAERILENEVALSLVRNAILEVLAVQSADELVKPEGKAALKRELVTQLSELVKPGEVRDVLYSDFVIQF